LALAWLLCLLIPGAVSGQLCDEEDMPPLAVFADSLIPPAVEWRLDSHYPPEGTYLDQIHNSYYTLEDQFHYYGLAAEPDDTEEEPPHYFLPFGWRNLDMVTFSWRRPTGSQILHEPTLRRGGLSAEDPAAPGTLQSISPGIIVRGSYTGHRDQLFVFEYRNGEKFWGDRVPSASNPALDAWNVSSHTIDGVLWYDTVELYIPIDGTRSISTELNWSEAYGPDAEFAFAPGDELLNGIITINCTYRRTGPEEVELLQTNMECAHGLYPEAWYPDDWDPEVDPSAYGIFLSFHSGVFTEELTYNLVGEEFDGFLIWRKVAGSDQDWSNIWKIARNEERDKFYWWWIEGEYQPNSPPYYGYDPVTLTPVFGQTDKRVFIDFDVHNGFQYFYAITTFDRGFRSSSGEGDKYIRDSALGILIEGGVDMAPLYAVADTLTYDLFPQEELEKRLYAVPNPLRTGKSAIESPTYHNYPGNVVRFVGLTPGSDLKVYSLAGDLIAEFGPDQMQGSNLVWDTRNQMGELVASGVYIFRAENPRGDEEYGRLAIIR